MSLGLMSGVQTQDMGWSFQEVHLCATHAMVAYRDKNDKAVNQLTIKGFVVQSLRKKLQKLCRDNL